MAIVNRRNDTQQNYVVVIGHAHGIDLQTDLARTYHVSYGHSE